MEEANTPIDDLLEAVRTQSLEVIDKHSENVPEELYHYTTTEGFLSIVSTKTLWATDVRFFNDWREIEYGLNLIGHVQAEQFEREHNDPAARVIFDAIGPVTSVEYSKIMPKCRFYAACFSENGDDLYQWRAYSNATKGHAIGFRLCDLGLDVCKIIYGKHNQKHITNELIGRWTALLRQRDLSERSIKTEVSRLLRSVVFRLALMFKDDRFSAEQEWRILVNHASRDVEYRNGQFGLTPHVCLDFSSPNPSTMPIVCVVQGPRVQPELEMEALAGFLGRHGYAAVERRMSQVPIRF